jgi:hypothetical protein
MTENTDNQREMSEKEKEVVEEQKRQRRVAQCSEEIRASLQKYECDLDVSVILRAGQVIPKVGVVPLEVLQNQRPQ